MSNKATEKFVVIGAGAFGTALAIYLANQQYAVTLIGKDNKEISKLEQNREQIQRLPGVKLPSSIELASSVDDYFVKQKELDPENLPIVLLVVPSTSFPAVVQQLSQYKNKFNGLIWGTKGLAEDGSFLHEVIYQYLGKDEPIACLSGPSFAIEVAKGEPTALTLATNNPEFGKKLISLWHSTYFRVYYSEDLIGVQLGGVVKNVLAIAVGLADGLGYGANARAALVTRGLSEFTRLGYALGGHASTLHGLSGLGDIVLSCTDNKSRNRSLGVFIGQGLSVSESLEKIGQAVEGVKNSKQLFKLAEKNKVEMPICRAVYLILHQGMSSREVVLNLLTREPKEE